ncbi:MAG: NTP transferase domain-containing protein [Actinomycetota bacterium]
MSTTIDAVILGGGKIKQAAGETLSASAEVVGKGLIRLSGREMIEYVIDALKNVERVRRIVVVAPESALHESWSSCVDAVIPTVGSAVDNGVEALKYLKENSPGLTKYVLFMTCDIPLITTEAIDDFLDRCQTTNDDVYYPVILREVVEAKYPETKRTYAKLRGATITGGNFALMEPEVILANLNLLEDAYSARKSVFQTLRLLGPKMIVKFLTRTLTLSDIEKRVTKIINARAKTIVTPYPEVGVDVDKPEDLKLVSKLMADART